MVCLHSSDAAGSILPRNSLYTKSSAILHWPVVAQTLLWSLSYIIEMWDKQVVWLGRKFVKKIEYLSL